MHDAKKCCKIVQLISCKYKYLWEFLDTLFVPPVLHIHFTTKQITNNTSINNLFIQGTANFNSPVNIVRLRAPRVFS